MFLCRFFFSGGGDNICLKKLLHLIVGINPQINQNFKRVDNYCLLEFVNTGGGDGGGETPSRSQNMPGGMCLVWKIKSCAGPLN